MFGDELKRSLISNKKSPVERIMNSFRRGRGSGGAFDQEGWKKKIPMYVVCV